MGRTSLMMVIGFNVIFMLMGYNLSSVSTHAYKSYTNYLAVEQAQFFAESAANIAVGSIYKDTTWMKSGPGTITGDLMGGNYTITAQRTTYFGAPAVIFTAIGNYGSVAETSIVELTRPSFSRYAMYTVSDGGIIWTDGEVCNGPLHTQGTLNIGGTTSGGGPTFNGRVTTRNGVSYSSGAPKNGFPGGYQTGVDVPYTSDYSSLTSKSGYAALDPAKTITSKTYYDTTYTYDKWGNVKTTTITGPFSGYDTTQSDVYVELVKNGSVIVRTGSWTATGTTYSSVSALSSTGVVGIIDSNSICNLHIKGMLGHTGTTTGQKLTLTNLSKTGNIFLDSSIVYKDTTLDMLGIVAKDSVYVTDNTNNNKDTVKIQASILAETFAAQNYDSRDAHTSTGTTDNGILKLLGGLQQDNRGAVGKGTKGFTKKYTYDSRLLSAFPPGYPELATFAVISWYERVNWSQNMWDSW
jgi:hypothetical protein